MKKYLIVTTYPEYGSRNVGDQLITDCLVCAIQDIVPGSQVETVWRAESWDSAKKKIENIEHVFFACLAIRPNMHENEYPWLSDFLNMGIPFSIISAGTALPVNQDKNIYLGFSRGAINLLRAINDRCSVFTTRGYLSQGFCQRYNLNKAVFGGDIAFYDRKFSDRAFVSNRSIKNIVISDPHQFNAYIPSMNLIINGLRDLFPNAQVRVVQHGVGEGVEEFCLEKKIPLCRVYEDRHRGLGIYDEADLHVGFRVHGHVSMLKRRKYSYLLEQDGRGCDYGITLERKISIPAYFTYKRIFSVKSLIKKILFNKFDVKRISSEASAYQMLALVANDANEGFVKFNMLERQIENFNSRSELSIKKAVSLHD